MENQILKVKINYDLLKHLDWNEIEKLLGSIVLEALTSAGTRGCSNGAIEITNLTDKI